VQGGLLYVRQAAYRCCRHDVLCFCACILPAFCLRASCSEHVGAVFLAVRNWPTCRRQGLSLSHPWTACRTNLTGSFTGLSHRRKINGSMYCASPLAPPGCLDAPRRQAGDLKAKQSRSTSDRSVSPTGWLGAPKASCAALTTHAMCTTLHF
jgi:hypothetical protein